MNRKWLAVICLAASGAIAQDAPPQTLFTDVHVFDGMQGERIENASVLVAGNRISAVSADAIDAPGAKVIDGGGRTLMPGLIDGHVHLNLTGAFHDINDLENAEWDLIGATAAANARDYLMDGYTTVRDTGGLSGVGLKRVIDSGILPGPRIYASSAVISQTSGHGDFRLAFQRLPGAALSNGERLNIAQIVDGVDAMRKAVRRNLSFQASFIKLTTGGGVTSVLDPLYSSGFTGAEIEAAVEEAAHYGTYVTVHAYRDHDVRRSIEAGVKAIEHGHMIQDDTMRMLVERGIFLVLNLAGTSPSVRSHPHYAPQTPSGKKLTQVLNGMRELKSLIRKYRPKVVHNVDTVLQTVEMARLHRDHEKWALADYIGNLAALRAMTSTAGELMALTGKRNPYPDGKLGVIAPGAYADIILVDGNPLEDLRVLGANEKMFDAAPRGEGIATIPFVMKDGQILRDTRP